MKSNNLEPCSVCGKTHTELIDVIYPLNREQTKWNVYCNNTLGGCGRIVYGTTEQEAIARWNIGIIDES